MTQIVKNMDDYLPLRSVKRHPMDKPWITSDIKIAIKKRQRSWIKGNFNDYAFYRNKTRRLCRRARRLFYSSTIKDSPNCNPRKWWNNIKRLAGLSKKQPLTCIYHNGQILKEHEMTEHIANSFCDVSKDITPLNFIPIKFASLPDQYVISPSDVHEALLNIKVHKAPGPDDIPNWLLKSNADLLCSPLSSIFNASISQGKVPSLWKSADVLGIPKTNKTQVTTDELRPISLTPTVSKILEGFVFKWLSEQILPYIDPYQFGNVKKSSTTHALIDLIHHWLAATDASGSVIRACMVDFSKAFDRIDHNILIKKLQNLNVHPCLINWCADFLRCRYLRVKVGPNKSSWKSVHAGVPQGTKLGPLLFLVMINDLKLYFPLYKYVDDCTLYEIVEKPYFSEIQKDLDELQNWTRANNMQLNVKKTKELRISFLNEGPSFEQLTANNGQVEIVSSFKLLGTIITSSLSWDQHVTYICSKASKRLYAIRLLKRSGVSISDLTHIFCSVVRPILEYGCQIWHFSLTEKQSNQIEQIQRRATKTILSDQISYDLRLERRGSFYSNI